MYVRQPWDNVKGMAKLADRLANSSRMYLHTPGQIWALACALDYQLLEQHGTIPFNTAEISSLIVS